MRIFLARLVSYRRPQDHAAMAQPRLASMRGFFLGFVGGMLIYVSAALGRSVLERLIS